MRTNGIHFQIKNMSNLELVVEMDTHFHSIQNNLIRLFRLHLDTFNVVKYHIDYSAIQGKLDI